MPLELQVCSWPLRTCGSFWGLVRREKSVMYSWHWISYRRSITIECILVIVFITETVAYKQGPCSLVSECPLMHMCLLEKYQDYELWVCGLVSELYEFQNWMSFWILSCTNHLYKIKTFSCTSLNFAWYDYLLIGHWHFFSLTESMYVWHSLWHPTRSHLRRRQQRQLAAAVKRRSGCDYRTENSRTWWMMACVLVCINHGLRYWSGGSKSKYKTQMFNVAFASSLTICTNWCLLFHDKKMLGCQ